MVGGVEKDYDLMFKLVVVGNTAVGKSALLVQYAESAFQESYVSTIGIDFKVRTIDVEGQRVKLQIWDTAGQERFQTIGAAYYRNTHGVIVVYDVTERDSFKAVENWIRKIRQNCEETVKIVLVGNKDDDPSSKVVQTNEAEEFANQMNIKLFETSAKENVNVDEMFYCVAELMAKACAYKTMARKKNQVKLEQEGKRHDKANHKHKRNKHSKLCSLV